MEREPIVVCLDVMSIMTERSEVTVQHHCPQLKKLQYQAFHMTVGYATKKTANS